MGTVKREKRRKLGKAPVPVQGGQKKQINDMVKWAEKNKTRRTK